MKNPILTTAISATLIAASSSAQAYLIFSGEDLNSSASVPLASTPNASGAEASFLSGLTGVGTEDFEGFVAGTSAPLSLTFPGAGTATLSGGSGDVVSVPSGSAAAGRYSIPSASSTNFWEVSAGSSGDFMVDLSLSIAAFGFYGIDIGDFGGQLQLSLSNGDLLTVPNTVGSSGSTDGSVLYYGIVAESAAEEFDSVTFLTSTGQGDVFGFDNFTIGTPEQVVLPAPEPGILSLIGLGLAGLGFKRFAKKRRS